MATRNLIGKIELMNAESDCRSWFERFELSCSVNEFFKTVPDLADDESNAAQVTAAKRANTAVLLSIVTEKNENKESQKEKEKRR